MQFLHVFAVGNKIRINRCSAVTYNIKHRFAEKRTWSFFAKKAFTKNLRLNAV
jgi:hypothetical protein